MPEQPGTVTLRTNFKQSPFEVTRTMSRAYAADLRKISREIERILNSVPLTEDALLDSIPKITAALKRYSEQLQPWAQKRATEIVQKLNRVNKRAWEQHAQNLSKGIRAELQNAPIQAVMQQYIQEQAAFVAELPLDAVERIEKLHQDILVHGRRADSVAKELEATGKVSATRATLIARTEIARTSNALTRARAEYVGAESYIWRTAKDGDVRASHRKMEGKVVFYDKPPLLEDGTVTHAGEIYNCRCYQEPIIPDSYF